MAVDSTGSKGQPQFDTTKPADTAVDQNAIANYAARVGNRMVGTEKDKEDVTTAGLVWKGLQFHTTDLGFDYEWFGDEGWKRQIYAGNGLVIRSGYQEITTNDNGDASIPITAMPQSLVGAIIQDSDTVLSNGVAHTRFNRAGSRNDSVAVRIVGTDGKPVKNWKTFVTYIALGF